MRVLYWLRPVSGGILHHVHELVHSLPFEVHVGGFVPYTLAETEIVRHPRPFRSRNALIRLSQQLKPDIIHVHGFQAALTAYLAQLPYVLTVHGFPPATMRWLALELIRSAELVFFMSNSLQTHFPSVHGQKLNNTVDARFFKTTRQLSDHPSLCVVSRLVPQKGIHLLIEALPQLQRVELHVVGDGPERRRLQRLGQTLGVAEQIYWHGHQTDVTPWLSRAWFYVQPSLQEGQGLSLLEAMAMGIPCIATKRGGLTETIVGRGLAIDPKVSELVTAVQRLLMDSTLAQRYAQIGHKYATNFTTEPFVTSVRTAYEQLLVDRTRCHVP